MPADPAAAMGVSPSVVSKAYLAACHAELDALKPGNVHRFAPGHGMDVAAFETSATVSAPKIAAGASPVGQRVLQAVQATWAAVGMNTNLGILLLSAPLAAAAETATRSGGNGAESLRRSLGRVLDGLTPADATDVFAAIALASPGGLGSRDAHDVRTPPTVSLLEAMRIASPADSVAAAYVDRFAGVFDVGMPAIAASTAAGEEGMWPAIRCFLAFAASRPDSHVVRKHGLQRARSLRVRMMEMDKRLCGMDNFESRQTALLALDTDLKAEGLNPGTSADLTVASIFAAELARRLEE